MDPNYNNQNQQNQNTEYQQPTQWQQQPQQQFNQMPPYQPNPYQQPPQEPKGMAIASLVLGILSVICCGWLLGVIGLILGIQGKKKAPSAKGLCTAGIVLSIIGIVFGAIFTILYATGSISLNSLYWNMY